MEAARHTPDDQPTDYFILFKGKSKMRRTASSRLGFTLALTLFLSGAALGQNYYVNSYNVGGPVNPTVTRPGGLKEAIAQTSANWNGGWWQIFISGDMVGDTDGVNDMAFPTLAKGQLNIYGNGHRIEAYPTYQNPGAGPTNYNYTHFFSFSGADTVVHLYNELTLVGAYRDGSGTAGSGGAMQVNQSEFRVSGTLNIENARARAFGGGMAFFGNGRLNRHGGYGDINISNSASQSGGGAFYALDSSHVSFGNSTFTNNMTGQIDRYGTVTNVNGSAGGAGYITNSNVDFRGYTHFDGNYAGGHGGGLYVEDSFGNNYPTLVSQHGVYFGIQALFTNNLAGNGGQHSDGGAIYGTDSYIYFSGTSAFGYAAGYGGNTASSGGAIAMVGDADWTDNKNTLHFNDFAEFYSNYARSNIIPSPPNPDYPVSGQGGALYTVGSRVIFSHVQFGDANVAASGNTASDGGAIYDFGGNYTFAKASAFYNNRASWYDDEDRGYGGAVFGSSLNKSANGRAGLFDFVQESTFGAGSALGGAGLDTIFGGNVTGMNQILLDTIGNPSPVGQAYLLRSGGGAIWLEHGSRAQFQSSAQFYGNYGAYGGAIALDTSARQDAGARTSVEFGYNSPDGTITVFGGNNAIYGGAINALNSEVSFNAGANHYTLFERNGDSTLTGALMWANDPGDLRISRQGGAISATENSLFTFKGKAFFYGNKTELDTSNGSSNLRKSFYAEKSGGGAIYANNSVFTFNAGNALDLKTAFGSEDTTTSGGNSAYTDGGAILAENKANFDFLGNVDFVNNTTGIGNGGAIYATTGSIFTFNDPSPQMVLFKGNKAGTAGAYGQGGAIYASGTGPETGDGAVFEFGAQTTVRFSLNEASLNGGAVKAENGQSLTFSGIVGSSDPLAVTDDTKGGFYTNKAGNDGGALMADTKANILFQNHVTFQNNEAGHFGGAIRAQGEATLTFENINEFLGNKAGDSGGAIYLDSNVDGMMTNLTLGESVSRFIDNSAASGSGGAIHVGAGGALTINGNAEFKNNTAGTFGGALAIAGMTDRLATVNLNTTATGQQILFQDNKAGGGANAIYLLENARLHIDAVEGSNVLIYDSISSQALSGMNNLFTKSGTGNISIWGTSDYWGDTVVEAGRFILAEDDGTGHTAGKYGTNNAGTFTLEAGSTLVLEAGSSLNAAQINLHGNTIEVSGNASSPEATLGAGVGGIQMAVDPLTEIGVIFDIKAGHQLTLQQALQDAVAGIHGNVVKNGEGTLVYDLSPGEVAKSYQGETIVNGGTLKAAVGRNDVLVSSSVLRLEGTGVFDMNNTHQTLHAIQGESLSTAIKLGTGTLTLDVAEGGDYDNLTFNGAITGSGKVIKNNDGTAIFGGGINGSTNYTGGTTINGGRLVATNTNAVGTNAILINDPGTLELDIASGSDNNFNNKVTGTGTLVKSGNGTATIKGTIDLTNPLPNRGAIEVNGGTLVVDDKIVVKANTVDINAGGNLMTLESGQVRTDYDFTARDGSTLTIKVGDIMNWTGPAIVSNNAIDVEQGASLNLLFSITSTKDTSVVLMHGEKGINGNFSGMQINGVTYNEESWMSLTSGIISCDGTDGCPEHTGSTSSAAKDLAITYGLAWYAGVPNSHGTFNIGSTDLVIGVDQGGGKSYVDFDYDGNGNTFVDVSRNDPRWDGSSLTKKGAGTMTLTTNNTYSGLTNIESGTLEVWKVGAISSSSGIVNNGVLRFNMDSGNIDNKYNIGGGQDGEFAKAITGTGRVEKTGDKTLTLSGISTFSGGLHIIDGAVVATNVQALGNGPIVNDSRLVFAIQPQESNTFRNIISGTGSLEKRDNGTLTIMQGNTYTGDTTITGGTLIAQKVGSLGKGNIHNNAILVYDINQASSGTTSQNIDGSGALVKRGDGTLVLGGTSAYTGGTTVESGILEGGTAKAFGDGNIDIYGGALLRFNVATTDPNNTYVGVISGAGTLEKTGAGNVILTNDNTYQGNTYINGGVLEVDKTSALGRGNAVHVNGENAYVQFNVAAENPIFLDAKNKLITGTGGVIKDGAGKFRLSGTHDYSGKTLVKAGEFELYGMAAGSSFEVTGASSRLTGFGTIGSLYIADGGTLAPGLTGTGNAADMIDTIQIGGGLAFGNNSFLEIQVSSDMSFDKVIAQSANLAAGQLKVSTISDASEFTKDQYTYSGILRGSLGGTKFLQLDSMIDIPGYTAQLFYSGDNTVSLALIKTGTYFNTIANNFNRREVGRSLDWIGANSDNAAFGSIVLALRNMSLDEAHEMLDQLAGDSIANGMMLGQWDVARPTLNRLSLEPSITETPRVRTRNRYWMDPFYQGQTATSDGNGSGYGIARPGFLMGIDRQFSPDFIGGISFGYSNPVLKDHGDKIEANDYQLGFYFATKTLPLGAEFKGYIGTGLQGYESERRFSSERLGIKDARLRAGYQGHSIISTFELSRPWGLDWGVVRPIAAFDLLTTTQGGRTETGNDLIAGEYRRCSFGRAFMRFGGRLDLAETDYASLWFHMFYAYKFAGEDAPETKFRFKSMPEMPSMTIRGSDPDKSYLSLGFGGHWNLNTRKTRQLFYHYDLNVAPRLTQNTGSLGFVQKF